MARAEAAVGTGADDCIACGAATRARGAVGGHPLRCCPACGLEFLHPQPDEAALDRIYGRHYYDAWGCGRDAAAARAMKLATFRRRIAALPTALPKGARVLDVGAGTGYFLEAALEAGFDPYAVELSDYGAECCRAKVGPRHVHCGELADARFDDCPEGRFDAIFMSDLIEHVRDPRATLDAAAGRLKAGGLLVLTTPWTDSASRRLGGQRWLHYKPEHLYYFGPGNLPRLLGEQGFVLESTQPASKCLSLAYAQSQLAAGGTAARLAGRILGLLPRSLLDRQLWLRIGEATLVARLPGPAAAG